MCACSLWYDIHSSYTAQSAGAVEFTDCISAEGKYFPHVFPGYDNKQSDDEGSVMLEL